MGAERNENRLRRQARLAGERAATWPAWMRTVAVPQPADAPAAETEEPDRG